MNIVSIDPGLNECGLAWWHDGRLVLAELVQSTMTDKTEPIDARIQAMSEGVRSLRLNIGLIVIERMEPRKKLEAAWSTLLDLAYISGRITAGYPTRFLRPSVWTGKRNKTVNHKRIRSRLDKDETAVLEEGLKDCPTDNRKEILDAVGIGLYHLERL
jgi:hypothetical protein